MLRRFWKNETGAITVDWVVLVAALVTLSVLVMLAITNSTTGLAGKLSTNVSSMSVGTP